MEPSWAAIRKPRSIMLIPIHPYAILSILSAVITLVAATIAWRRSAPGSVALGFLLLAMAIWSSGYATRWLEVSIPAKMLWFKIMFIGVVSIPTLFFIFALGFTRSDAWLSSHNMVLLSIPPVFFLFLQWTNPYQLFYRSLDFVQDSGYMLMEITRGLGYLVNVIYSYTLIGGGILLMSQAALRSGPLYRYQYRLILFAALLPWVGNAIKEFNFKTYSNLDIAPLIFGLSGIIFVFAILRTHLMDVIPVARSYLIETMHDGVLVLDLQYRIVDINPAMEGFLSGRASSYLGKNAYEVLKPWMVKTNLFVNKDETRSEVTVPLDPTRYLDLNITPLYDRNQILSGHLMVFRDITERKQVEKRLRYVNDRLQAHLIEIGLLQSKLREQAIRDPLTDLFNRRYLEETLDRELSRAAREEYPICIIMIDLDHFKRINDTYGHEAGDVVLKAIADVLAEQSRRGDFACRYGGEEFVIVMPNVGLETAYERAESLRQSLTLLRVPYEYYSLSVTISMGIACFPENGQTREVILRAADQAMYAAKDAGRDHILSYNQLQRSENLLED
jgi:diguanylate cyclase (GGDEF)-like protein/PAS domain S-box-containing protein